jgi:hypothetical protein
MTHKTSISPVCSRCGKYIIAGATVYYNGYTKTVKHAKCAVQK